MAGSRDATRTPPAHTRSCDQAPGRGNGRTGREARPWQRMCRRITPDRIMQLGSASGAPRRCSAPSELGLFTELAKGAARRRRRCGSGWACTRAARATSSTRWWRWACWSARATATPTRRRPDLFLDRAQGRLRRRLPGDGQRPAVRLLGPPDRGPADRASRRTSRRAAATSSRPSTATRARLRQFLRAMTGISLASARAIAREVPLGRLPDLRRHRHGAGRPARAGRAGAPAPERARLRPAGRSADLRGVRRRLRPAGPAAVSAGRLLPRPAARRPTCW